MKLIVYASKLIETAPNLIEGSGALHYNVAADDAKAFTAAVERDDSKLVLMTKVVFANLDTGSEHVERQKPFCIAGDRERHPDDHGGIFFGGVSGEQRTPRYIPLESGIHRYQIVAEYTDGSKESLRVHFHVGAENFVGTSSEPPTGEPVRYSFLLPILVWVTRDERVSGIPEDRIDEFAAKVEALYSEYERPAVVEEG